MWRVALFDNKKHVQSDLGVTIYWDLIFVALLNSVSDSFIKYTKNRNKPKN
jgi:hypothetical protein